jgi:hypothetical protein
MNPHPQELVESNVGKIILDTLNKNYTNMCNILDNSTVPIEFTHHQSGIMLTFWNKKELRVYLDCLEGLYV